MILSSLVQIIGTAGLLATTPVALPVQCRITKAPIINIRPVTKKIDYDLSKTSAQLNQLQSNTISPYGLGVDQTTGGLRHDQPTIKTTMTFNVITNQQSQFTCLSYNTINVDIKLKPKIYIAKEFNEGRCAREVVEHERKHVYVDRKIMNKYTKLMGKAVQKAVNDAGVIGPFASNRTENFQDKMAANIKSALSSVELSMQNEMNREQQQIDSLEEYERVSKHCKNASKRVQQAREEALKNQRK